MRQSYEKAAIFLFGASMGTVIGLLLAALFSPQSILEKQAAQRQENARHAYLAANEKDDVGQRIRAATDTWVSQLRHIADDLVAQGRLSSEEAKRQINELLAKVRS